MQTLKQGMSITHLWTYLGAYYLQRDQLLDAVALFNDSYV